MNEKRIGVLGNVDSGKSTIISVLKENVLDNGRGLARKKTLKHIHERDSGRTSSVTHHYYQTNNNQILSFVDLAGHEKYYKTTIFGALGCSLDYIMILVGANMGVTHMTIEHIVLAIVSKLPFIFVITKIDICPKNILEQTIKSINRTLKRYKYNKPLVFLDNSNYYNYYDFFNKKDSLPAFQVSNVSGENIDCLRNFLNGIYQTHNWDTLKNKDVHFIIEDIYFVKGVGIVVTGTLDSGTVIKGDKLMIGPFYGIFYEVQVKSIHNNFKTHVDTLEAGKSGCFNIKSLEKKFTLKREKIRKGMVMINKENSNHTYTTFEAKVKILHHPSTISKNYESMIHCGSIKQIATIIDIEQELLRTGDQSKVKFRFKLRPEFIQKDKQIIFREGKTKGVGVVTNLLN